MIIKKKGKRKIKNTWTMGLKTYKLSYSTRPTNFKRERPVIRIKAHQNGPKFQETSELSVLLLREQHGNISLPLWLAVCLSATA